MGDDQKLYFTVAKALCRERCAVYGEPPCSEMGVHDFECEDDTTCATLASAVVDALSPPANPE